LCASKAVVFQGRLGPQRGTAIAPVVEIKVMLQAWHGRAMFLLLLWLLWLLWPCLRACLQGQASGQQQAQHAPTCQPQGLYRGIGVLHKGILFLGTPWVVCSAALMGSGLAPQRGLFWSSLCVIDGVGCAT
jgi:hypothetical protein